jgi:hypothetical protein
LKLKTDYYQYATCKLAELDLTPWIAAGNPVASVLRRAARPDGTASAAAASDAAAASKAEPFMFSILTPA